MVSTEFKGVGLHYTAFRDAIREDSRQTTPSRGVTPRKKFAVEANVESRAITAFLSSRTGEESPKGATTVSTLPVASYVYIVHDPSRKSSERTRPFAAPDA